MGIIEDTLAEFTLSDGTEYRVEYNEGGIIHIHIDSMRIDLTEDEFVEFSSVILEGSNKLKKSKEVE